MSEKCKRWGRALAFICSTRERARHDRGQATRHRAVCYHGTTGVSAFSGHCAGIDRIDQRNASQQSHDHSAQAVSANVTSSGRFQAGGGIVRNGIRKDTNEIKSRIRVHLALFVYGIQTG